MKGKRHLIGAFLVFFLVNVIVGCSAPKTPQNVQQSLSLEDTPIPEYVARDVVHYSYENGVLKVKVQFTKGEFYGETQELYVENCNFVYYDITGAVVSRGSSKRAVLYNYQPKLVAEDEVVVISELNRGKLETDLLEWHGDKDKFTTDSFVTIIRFNGDTIAGYGLLADIALRYVTIKKNVRGSIKEDRE